MLAYPIFPWAFRISLQYLNGLIIIFVDFSEFQLDDDGNGTRILDPALN